MNNIVNLDNIDIEKLREDIVRYYLTMSEKLPIARNDAKYFRELATEEEILAKAINMKIDLNGYIKQNTFKK